MATKASAGRPEDGRDPARLIPAVGIDGHGEQESDDLSDAAFRRDVRHLRRLFMPATTKV